MDGRDKLAIYTYDSENDKEILLFEFRNIVDDITIEAQNKRLQGKDGIKQNQFLNIYYKDLVMQFNNENYIRIKWLRYMHDGTYSSDTIFKDNRFYMEGHGKSFVFTKYPKYMLSTKLSNDDNIGEYMQLKFYKTDAVND